MFHQNKYRRDFVREPSDGRCVSEKRFSAFRDEKWNWREHLHVCIRRRSEPFAGERDDVQAIAELVEEMRVAYLCVDGNWLISGSSFAWQRRDGNLEGSGSLQGAVRLACASLRPPRTINHKSNFAQKWRAQEASANTRRGALLPLALAFCGDGANVERPSDE